MFDSRLCRTKICLPNQHEPILRDCRTHRFPLGFILNNYLPAYLKGKGANLATKEDIAKITKLQEEVKHSFNVLLE